MKCKRVCDRGEGGERKGGRMEEGGGGMSIHLPVRLGSSGRMRKVKKDSTRLSISAHVST